MGKIVAIGGGELKDLETLGIDREIVRMTGKKHPNALFIPTASGDAEGYCETFKDVYERRLGCKVDFLCLTKGELNSRQIREKIFSSDIIYVGGGNTQKMLRIWRKKGVDDLLKKAYDNGVVLSGLSAGAICWFRYGSSDSKRFSDSKNKSLMRLSGIGLVNLVVSPHHRREPHRKEGLVEIMRRTPGRGIALDDNSALEINNEKFRIIRSDGKSKAYKVYFSRGRLHYEELDTKGFVPLSELYK